LQRGQDFRGNQGQDGVSRGRCGWCRGSWGGWRGWGGRGILRSLGRHTLGHTVIRELCRGGVGHRLTGRHLSRHLARHLARVNRRLRLNRVLCRSQPDEELRPRLDLFAGGSVGVLVGGLCRFHSPARPHPGRSPVEIPRGQGRTALRAEGSIGCDLGLHLALVGASQGGNFPDQEAEVRRSQDPGILPVGLTLAGVFDPVAVVDGPPVVPDGPEYGLGALGFHINAGGFKDDGLPAEVVLVRGEHRVLDFVIVGQDESGRHFVLFVGVNFLTDRGD